MTPQAGPDELPGGTTGRGEPAARNGSLRCGPDAKEQKATAWKR